MMLEEKLENRDIKPTAMRLLVLKELLEAETAISLKKLEARFDRADKATLYRTLKTFQDNKLIHGVEDGTGSVVYALCEEDCECGPQDQHVHFHCEVCGETYCLTQAKIPVMQIPIGFKAREATMVYQGSCANCS